ncbi:MAG TPA: hypothetical protein VKV28_08725 [Candidatus Binataceae bacterium]|nr:hypothetical protein [Candidatus Binataceae bacterium]
MEQGFGLVHLLGDLLERALSGDEKIGDGGQCPGTGEVLQLAQYEARGPTDHPHRQSAGRHRWGKQPARGAQIEQAAQASGGA